MVFVEGGTFIMGSEDSEAAHDERPLHCVILNSYYIGRYEVTQAEWVRIMRYNPSYFKDDERPVESISWNEVQIFISELNTKTGKTYRLPTEAEWEYAARGGNQTKGYKYSGSNNLHDVAWFWGNTKGQTSITGEKMPNELGLYDMSGNVHEWCNNWYDSIYYLKNSVENPQGPNFGEFRVFRGGCWNSDKEYCRTANRGYKVSDFRNPSLGFRLAEDVD